MLGSAVSSWLGVLAALVLASAPCRAQPLAVVASVPDLGDLVRTVGGEQVRVTVLTRGPQDAHFLEPRPSFIRALHDADLWVQNGMELEIGWAPALLRSARNPRVLPGALGHLDASTAIEQPLDVPHGPVDRSMGDVHRLGNPHYTLDPLNALHVARAIRDRLAALRPEQAGRFQANHAAFARRLAERLVGPALAARHDPEELARRLSAQAPEALAEDAVPLGGWLAAARPLAGQRAVEDHGLWAYFARRFGIELVATLEPRPGIAPSTRHLGEVVEIVRSQGVSLILSTPYFDVRHARLVAERSGARVARMAHQVGAREGADDYLATVDYNLREALAALGSP